jgi:hypothetical protein
MLNCPDVDPDIAGAAYMEFHACVGWLFDDASDETRRRGCLALGAIEALRPASALEARLAARTVAAARSDIPPETLARAEAYARRSPLLAARIRAAGGLTAAPVAGFSPAQLPDRAVAWALADGTTPVLAARDGGKRRFT